MPVLLQVNTEFGFLTNQTKNPNIIGEVEPYQFNPELRPNSTLRFYRNLDLESCLWEFVSYYDMSELISDCGGDINTDGQVRRLLLSLFCVQNENDVSLMCAYFRYQRRNWIMANLTNAMM